MSAARGFPAFPPRPGRRGRSWWAREFVAALEDAAHDATVLRRGRRFASSGRLGPIAVAPGRMSAMADDPEGVADVVVRLNVLTDAEWDRFTAQVAAESGHLAALLDGEVPRTLVEAADAAGVALLPGVGELESDCTCPDIGDPCMHSAALCHQTAWLLDDDPFVLLLLRGRDGRELLDALGTPTAEPVTDTVLDLPAPAAEAYAADPGPLPDRPERAAGPPAPAVPPPPGLPPDLLPRLAVDAARRARALLAAGDRPG